MGILRNVWEEERNDVVYGKIVRWESHSSSGGGLVFDGHRRISGGDGWVFEGGRWIRYYNGWSTVPVGRGVAGNNMRHYDQYHVAGSHMNHQDYHFKQQQQQQIPVRVSLVTQGQGKEDHNYHVRENNMANYDHHRHIVGHNNNNYNMNNDHYEARVGANNYTVLQPAPQNVRPQVVMVKSSPNGQQWQQQQPQQQQQQQVKSSLNEQQWQQQQPQQQQQQQQVKSSLSGQQWQQQQQQQQRQHQHHIKDKEQEDVDAKAEDYIRKKKQKFAQASIMEY